MSKLILEIDVDDNATQLVQKYDTDSNSPKPAIDKMINLLSGLAGGAYNGNMNVKLGVVNASRFGTFTGAPTNGETTVINGVTFTAVTSGATGNQFNIGGTVTITAANMAAAINASASAGIQGVIFASSSAGVITLTVRQGGAVGNSIVWTENLSNFTLNGSAFTGGAQSTNKTYNYGLAVAVPYL